MKQESKIKTFFQTIKDVILFPFTEVKKNDDYRSDSAWLRRLKAMNLKSSRIPGNSRWTKIGARSELREQKDAARRYTITRILITSAIVASTYLIKKHLDKVAYDKKRLEDLQRKVNLNQATEKEVNEAVALCEGIFLICEMEDPSKTSIVLHETEEEILREVT